MKEKKVKKWLNLYQAPPLNEKQVDNFIEKFEKSSFLVKRISYIEFARLQFCSIRKRTWIIQGIALVCWWLLYSMKQIQSDSMFDLYPYLSIMAPIICCIGVDELSRIYENHFYELELTTRFPLKTILLTRMAIMGITDLLGLTAMGILIKQYVKMNVINTLIYIMVPFLISCVGMLIIMRWVKGEYLNYFFFGYAAILGAVPFTSEIVARSIYEQRFLIYWEFAGVITLGVLVLQILTLCKKLNSMEDISKNEFRIG